MMLRSIRRVALFRPRNTRGGSGHAADAHGHGHGHGEHFNEPAGFLFQRKPGQHYSREGWELPWFVGMYGTLILGTIALANKPDTRVRSWAEREAQIRLDAANAKF